MARELEALFDRFARRGDVDALEQVFDRTAPELLRIAIHLASDAAQAEDLVQATFVRALENAARFEPERELLPWLIGILAHEAARARRDGARVVDPERVRERASAAGERSRRRRRHPRSRARAALKGERSPRQRCFSWYVYPFGRTAVPGPETTTSTRWLA